MRLKSQIGLEIGDYHGLSISVAFSSKLTPTTIALPSVMSPPSQPPSTH
jgi:hypothetical protein